LIASTRLVLRALLLLEARAGGDVGLATDDRLHARCARLLVELDRAEQVAVVAHADRALAERLHLIEQRRQLDRAVEQRILGVQVKMRESVFRDHRNPGAHQRRAEPQCRRVESAPEEVPMSASRLLALLSWSPSFAAAAAMRR
jgi:hypothetical protein